MQTNYYLEDDEAIRQLLKRAGLKADDDSIKLECINNEKDEGKLAPTLLLRGPFANVHVVTTAPVLQPCGNITH